MKAIPIENLPSGWSPGWSWLEYKGIWWAAYIASKHAQHAHLHGPFAKDDGTGRPLTVEIIPLANHA